MWRFFSLGKCYPPPPRKLTWQAGKSPCLIGDTSSNGCFSIVMLVFVFFHPKRQRNWLVWKFFEGSFDPETNLRRPTNNHFAPANRPKLPKRTFHLNQPWILRGVEFPQTNGTAEISPQNGWFGQNMVLSFPFLGLKKLTASIKCRSVFCRAVVPRSTQHIHQWIKTNLGILLRKKTVSSCLENLCSKKISSCLGFFAKKNRVSMLEPSMTFRYGCFQK